MNSTCKIRQTVLTAAVFLAACSTKSFSESTTNSPAGNEIRIVELQGSVQILPAGATKWVQAEINQGLQPFDRIHTADNSRVALRWSDQSIVPFGASTELEILAPDSPDAQAGLHLIRGVITFFHRDKPGRIRIITRGAMAGVEGTEFILAVNDAECTTLSVVDGKVKFGNERGMLLLTNGEQAAVELGNPPVRSAGFVANNLLQWCFYYPAVIDPDELPLTADEQNNLADSLGHYRAGNLLGALEKFPTGNTDSAAVKIYYAALVLSVGEVEKAEATLSGITDKSNRPQQLVDALRKLIVAVKRQPAASTSQPRLASEFLADSYFEQSQAIRETSLNNALYLAKEAVKISPKFSFAWERVAELEFSFGRAKNALTALEKSLMLAPQNAQALALKGFILAAQNQPREARGWFDRAIAADAALGNAWLGRGLTRIRMGDKRGGQEDLLVAAALEPQRAELRSYLGKAYMNAGDDARSAKELALAKKLDPNDPTAWLYSALLNQRKNEINNAIRDLETSQQLNDNRSVYRSQLLLDEDRAVRSANLAGVYRDAGMLDVSKREAGRAVSSDYANYSAHLFLANSYEQLRDLNWSNLRYETPANAEFWIANLLAPTSAGWLSSTISESPYAKLFDQSRLGIVSDTEYLSRGAWTEKAEHFYTSGDFSYGVGTSYIYDPGQRANNDNQHWEWDVNLKGQLTTRDSIFLAYQESRIKSGDVNEYYDQPTAPPDVRFEQTQSPNLFFGYHHEWSPGIHTLFFASRSFASNKSRTSMAGHWVASTLEGEFQDAHLLGDADSLTIATEAYSTELQQIFEQPNHTTIIGGRYFWGDVRFQNLETSGYTPIVGIFPDPFHIIAQDFTTDFHHLTLYGYHDWQILESLKLSGGLSYDWLHYPAVVDSAPFSPREKTTAQFSPKAGLVWNPLPSTIVRAAYTRSLSGFINGSSIRLEPTEVAGFNQAYRSLIPDTVIGDSSGSQLDIYNLSLEQKFGKGTYLGLSGEVLYSKGEKTWGAFIFVDDEVLAGVSDYPIYPRGLKQSLDYRECAFTLTADQLLGEQWSVGARYRLSQANLNLRYTDVHPATLLAFDPSFKPQQNLESVLHTVNLHANWNHSSGLFSILEANWYHQNNSGFSPVEAGDDFWQFNISAGYRFWHRKAELTVGVLNLGDQDYRLEPLNLYNETARSRTFFARLLFSF